MTTEVRFKDFTEETPPIQFKIDDDYFDAPHTLPIPSMQVLASVGKSMQTQGDKVDPSVIFDKLLSVFDTILTPESAQRFRARAMSTDRPISITQLHNIFMWLLEVYGMRPTEPSSVSSSGSPTETDGTTSTVGVLPTASIL